MPLAPEQPGAPAQLGVFPLEIPPENPPAAGPGGARSARGPLPITGFILAGGQSRRMGRDKALLPVGDKPLIAHVAGLLGQVCAEVAVVDARPERYRFLGLPVLTDRRPGFGPLSGIHAGLSSLAEPWGLFVACDMPGLQPPVLHHLASLALATDGGGHGGDPVDAVVPCRDGRPEPLLAVYHRRLLPVIEGILDGGGGPVRQLLASPGVRVRWVPEAELRALDPSLRSLVNVNTPDQWRNWRRSAGHDP